MPSAAVLYGTGLITSASYPYSIVVGSTEIAPASAELDSIWFEETGDDEPGYFGCRVWDPTNSLTIGEQNAVRVQDNTADEQVWLGTVLRRWSTQKGPGRYVDIEAVTAGSMLDEIIVIGENRPPESDRQRVAYLWGKYARYPLGPETASIAQTNASIAADVLSEMTLRAALNQTAGLAGTSTRFYVNAMGNLVWRSGNGSTAAPDDIMVGTPGAGEIAPNTLTVTRDGVIKNRYFVRGSTPAGSDWFQDDGSVNRYGPREDILDAPSSDTAAKAQTIAQLALGKTAQPNIRAEFSVIDPNSGWRADQNVTVTSAADDLSAEVLRVVKVKTTFWRGDGKRKYEVSAGKTGGRFSGVT
jgi:hypothetical protein